MSINKIKEDIMSRSHKKDREPLGVRTSNTGANKVSGFFSTRKINGNKENTNDCNKKQRLQPEDLEREMTPTKYANMLFERAKNIKHPGGLSRKEKKESQVALEKASASLTF